MKLTKWAYEPWSEGDAEDEENGVYKVTGGMITGGVANHVEGDYYGGGIYVNGGSLTMESGTVIGNAAIPDDGHYACGGVYVENGSIVMNGGAISSNQADCGGGFYLSGGSLTINSGAVISKNSLESLPERIRHQTDRKRQTYHLRFLRRDAEPV